MFKVAKIVMVAGFSVSGALQAAAGTPTNAPSKVQLHCFHSSATCTVNHGCPPVAQFAYPVLNLDKSGQIGTSFDTVNLAGSTVKVSVAGQAIDFSTGQSQKSIGLRIQDLTKKTEMFTGGISYVSAQYSVTTDIGNTFLSLTCEFRPITGLTNE